MFGEVEDATVWPRSHLRYYAPCTFAVIRDFKPFFHSFSFFSNLSYLRFAIDPLVPSFIQKFTIVFFVFFFSRVHRVLFWPVHQSDVFLVDGFF